MMGSTSCVQGVLAEILTPIPPNIGGEPTREALINLHRLIIGNTESLVSNLGEGQHGHLALTMISEYYMEEMGYTFFPPHNPGYYPPTMGNSQEQAHVT